MVTDSLAQRFNSEVVEALICHWLRSVSGAEPDVFPDACEVAGPHALKETLDHLESVDDVSLWSVFGIGVTLGVAAATEVLQAPLSDAPREAIGSALEKAKKDLHALAIHGLTPRQLCTALDGR